MSACAKSRPAATRPAPKARCGDPDPPERQRAVETRIRLRRVSSGSAADDASGEAATASARPAQQRHAIAAVDDAERAPQRRRRGEAPYDERRESEAGQVAVRGAGAGYHPLDDVLGATLVRPLHRSGPPR